MDLTRIVSSFEESGDVISAMFEPSHEEMFFVLKGKNKVRVPIVPKEMLGHAIHSEDNLTPAEEREIASKNKPKEATHYASSRVYAPSRVAHNGAFCYYLIRYYSV